MECAANRGDTLLIVDEVENVAVCPSCWEERELFEADEEYLCERCLEGGYSIAESVFNSGD